MTSIPLLLALTVVAGACLAIQAGMNTTLARWAGSPVMSAVISFALGTVAVGLYALVTRTPAPPFARASELPWWGWAGGALGGFYVVTIIVAAPRIGAATTLGLIVAGQMVTSVLLDHTGWLGFAVRPASAGRIAGAALVIAGVVLIRRL